MLNGELIGVRGLSGEIQREVIAGGGGSGTTEYPELNDLPQINGVELVGDKTSKELGLVDADDLKEYVKNTDYASDTKVGVVRISNYRGMKMLTGGIIAPIDATTTQIDNRHKEAAEDTSKTTAVTLNRIDYAVKVGLTTNTETLSDEEKTSAQTWLGVENKLDRTTESGYRVYSSSNGKDSTIAYTDSVVGNTIPIRRDNNNFQVGTPQKDRECANKKYVDQKVADLVNSAPETLDTLGEVAKAIEENADVVDALNNAIGNKADKTDLTDYVQKKDTALILYGTNANGQQTTWALRYTNNTPNTIAGRDSYGNIQVRSAVNDSDAVNKKYLEEAISNKVGFYDFLSKEQYENGEIKELSTEPIYLRTSGGIYIAAAPDGSGRKVLRVVFANDTQVKNQNQTMPISTDQISLAVKTGLTANKLTLTDEEKAKAQNWLGVESSSSTDNTEGNIILLGADGFVQGNRVVFEIQDAESFIDYRTNQREFLIDMLLPLVGTLDDTLQVAITFGDTTYNVFNSLSSTTPIKIGDLKSGSTYNTETGYRFYSKFVFVQTSDVVGFVVSPATINAHQLSEIVESNDSIVVGLDSTETKLSVHLNNDITNKLSRTLVTPVSRPSATEIVAVDNTGTQAMLEIGSGLTLENNILSATGGGGTGGSVDLSNYYTKEETDALFVTSRENLLKVSPVEVEGNMWALSDSDGNSYRLEVEENKIYEIEYIVEGVTYKQQSKCMYDGGGLGLGVDITDPSNIKFDFVFTTSNGVNCGIVLATQEDFTQVGILNVASMFPADIQTPVTIVSIKEAQKYKYALTDNVYTKNQVYTKEEIDNRNYTKEETDNLFIQTGKNLYNGSLYYYSPEEGQTTLVVPLKQSVEFGDIKSLGLKLGRTYTIELWVQGVQYMYEAVATNFNGDVVLGIDKETGEPQLKFIEINNEECSAYIADNIADNNSYIKLYFPEGMTNFSNRISVNITEVTKLKYALSDDTYTKAEVMEIVESLEARITELENK